MAFINCPQCGKPIREEEVTCPYCHSATGVKQRTSKPEKPKMAMVAVLVVLVVAAVVLLVLSQRHDSMLILMLAIGAVVCAAIIALKFSTASDEFDLFKHNPAAYQNHMEAKEISEHGDGAMSNILRQYCKKTEISEKEYLQAKAELSETDFSQHYFRGTKKVQSSECGQVAREIEQVVYYRTSDIPDNLELVILDQINQDTKVTAQATKNIWTVVLINLICAIFLALFFFIRLTR